MSNQDFAIHEILDRSHVIAKMFERYVLDHPRSKEHPQLQQRAQTLSDQLHDFYQAVGGATLK